MSALSTYRSILVGTDGSETAGIAVDQAIDLAQKFGAELVLVSAYEPTQRPPVAPAAPAAAGAAASTPLNENWPAAQQQAHWEVTPREDALAVLGKAAHSAEAAGVTNVETFARQGDPADAILDVAEERSCDLIVVGNKGMTGARRFLLGSVPNKISHHAPCSVLIVRTT